MLPKEIQSNQRDGGFSPIEFYANNFNIHGFVVVVGTGGASVVVAVVPVVVVVVVSVCGGVRSVSVWGAVTAVSVGGLSTDCASGLGELRTSFSTK